MSGDAGSESAEAGVGAAGSAGAAGAPPVHRTIDCTRDGLAALVDRYFEALAAHDPARLPLASSVKFTENAQQIQVGEGLWKTAGQSTFQRNVLDTETCGTLTEAVIDSQGAPAIFGVRLKLENQQVTEIESLLVSGSPFSPAGLQDSARDNAEWESILAVDQRSTREQLNAIADAYFDSIADPAIVPAFGTPCSQISNGVEHTTETCKSLYVPLPVIPGLPQINASPTDRRYPVADLEAGIAVGFGIMAEGVLGFNLFKVIGGKIRFVNSVAGPPATSSGWDPP